MTMDNTKSTMGKAKKVCGKGKTDWTVDSDGFNTLQDGIGNRFRIGDRVKYMSKKRPELQFKVFTAMNYVRDYDRRERCWVDTIELDNGVWVRSSEVFANVG